MSEEIVIITQSEIEEQVKADLISSGFSVTNWSVGSRMRRLLAAFAKPVSELYSLINTITKQMYLKTATGSWLILKGEDEGVPIKEATKTQGLVLMGRNEVENTTISIPKNSIVKTQISGTGTEFRYIVDQTVVLGAGVKEISVPVIAEFEGSEYNIGAGLITVFLTHIDGLDYVTNGVDWITKVGTDQEDPELYRARIMNEKKLRRGDFIALYKSLATSVTGVKDAVPITNHPRGQGTIDIVIVTESGVVPSTLLQEVQAAINAGKEPCADVLAIAAQTQAVNLVLNLTVATDVLDLEPFRTSAMAIIDADLSGKKIGEKYIKAQTVSKLMALEKVKNAVIATPSDDVTPASSILLIKGTVTINVAREV